MPEQATFVTFDNIVNGWRQRLLFYIDTSIWGKIWEITDFLINVAFCIIYVVNTSYVDENKDPSRIPSANRQVEFVLAVVFLGQYVMRFVIINTNHRTLEHLVVAFAFIAPMAAYIMSMHSTSVRNSYMSAGVMLAIAASSTRYIKLTLIRQEAAALAGDIIVAILFFASVVHSGINWYSQANKVEFTGFTFLDAIYFIAMSALGQDGSIPRSTFSEIVSMAIVALIAFAVPSRVTKLVDLALRTSAYNKTVTLPAASRHAVVCGFVEPESIRQFLHEFFNADHGPNIFATTIVILHSDEPSMEMKALLQDPAYTNRVFYVKGKATSFKALKRARVDLATCVYILARKHTHGSAISEDASTVLIALALSAFGTSGTREHRRPDGRLYTTTRRFQVYAQTILPNSISHLAYLQAARVVCVDEMRMGVMAQNCATPGFAALAFMLSTSVAGHVDWDFSGVVSEEIARSADDSWVKSYLHGIGQEIYQAHVPSSLVGKTFLKAARYFYRCHGMLVFGVGSYTHLRSPASHLAHHPAVDASPGHYQVLLAPRNYMLQKHDMLFAIAADVQQVLDAMVYAERVSIKSARIEKPQRKHAMATPPPSPQSLGRRAYFWTGPAATAQADAPEDSDAPVQDESPRRMVARTPLGRGGGGGSSSSRRAPNYLSSSSSEYFSPGHQKKASSMGEPPADTPVDGPSARGTGPRAASRRPDPVPGDLAGHVVVCDASTAFPRNIELLVHALRGAYADAALAVVILSPGDPPAQQKLLLADLPHLYHVRGSPLSQPDLQRTRIQQAQKAVVLGTCSGVGDAGESSADSSAILTNMNIQTLCGGMFFTTTELLDIESIRYLDHTQLLGEPLLKRTFMGGHIFMPSMLDTALCQCYFSSHILDVLHALTFSHQGGAPLRLLHVPQRFVGKRYDTLVLTLMKQHRAVALGLYRFVTQDAQTFAAVMCNPRPATPLMGSDAVYVLGPGIPGWRHFVESPGPLAIAPPPLPQRSEERGAAGSPASKAESSATRDAGQSSASGQSRHTVYSHNTERTPDSLTPAAEHPPSALAATSADDDADADAELSDADSRSPFSFASTTPRQK
ncbi:hypothetical protein GGI15_003744 [Coemansia interrupta]|uniref:Calcium-activated potassium channel BK alpha subunit domain-containing protein n=1 Tax=Coemansia interrupta TaxID=1126814 RepID=A0A9W8LFU0_9FUNG|nr:hypothetical protein GGI15_003744 [Coemansia interrupta]